MFTGIVEELGIIKSLKISGSSGKINIKAGKVLEGTKIGDSIAVNGICLTVVSMGENDFTADVMAETVRRSSLKDAKAGDGVNLERALCLKDRLGGHIVSGHIDDTGSIREVKKEENATWVTVNAGENILKYIVEKGSVALDGISLTVARVDCDCFSVSVIPHTGAETTLLTKKKGEYVNIETDIIGKYTEKLLGLSVKNDTTEKGSLTMDFLKEMGI